MTETLRDLLTLASGLFWIGVIGVVRHLLAFFLILVAAIVAFATLRKKRRRLAWAALVALPILVPLSTAAWEMFEDLVFNSVVGPLTNQVRVYRVLCDGRSLNGQCCGKLGVPLDPETFFADVKRQQVWITFDHGWIAPYPSGWRPLENCEVLNRLNWACTTYWRRNAAGGLLKTGPNDAERSDTTTMAGGKYYESSSDDYSLHPGPTVYVSSYAWWTGQFRQDFDARKGFWDPERVRFNPYVAQPDLCADPGYSPPRESRAPAHAGAPRTKQEP